MNAKHNAVDELRAADGDGSTGRRDVRCGCAAHELDGRAERLPEHECGGGSGGRQQRRHSAAMLPLLRQ